MLKKDFSVKILSETRKWDMTDIFVKSRPQLLKMDGTDVYDNLGNVTSIFDYNKKLIDFDLSLSYFPVYNLEVESSILFRDYFYSFNTLGRWAFTHRNGMPEELYSSSEVYNEDEEGIYKEFKEKIKEWESGEIDFDTARGYMPLSLSTRWHISISAKMLMRVLGQLHSEIGNCDTFRIIWTEFATLFPEFIHLVGKYDYPNITEGYFPPTITKRIGFNLYAQLIRHEDVYVTGIGSFLDDYLKIFKINSPTPSRTCNAPINVSISVPEKRWRDIIKTRTAWFSMTDNWGDENSWSIFLKDYITGDLQKDKPYLKYFDDNGNFDGSSISSYSIDDNLRVRSGKTPYFPDAFALESRKIVLDRIASRGDNPLFQDYLQIFDKGYVRDNPENELRVKWESLTPSI